MTLLECLHNLRGLSSGIFEFVDVGASAPASSSLGLHEFSRYYLNK